ELLAGGATQVPEHRIDQRRLANPGLAGDESDLPPATGRRAEPFGDLGPLRRPTDHDAVLCRAAVVRGLRRIRSGAPPGGARRRDEAVAASRDRLDEAGRRALVAERLAQLADRKPHDVLGDRDVA